jgi:DUF4097 and DUF4098 domain-containing protein YvlB
MKLIFTILLLASHSALAATEERTNKTFKVTAGGMLVVDVAGAAIEVTTNSTDEVAIDVFRKVTRKSKADEEQFFRDNPVQFVHDGNTVTVRCQHKSQKSSWFNWGWGHGTEGKFTIRVPAQFNAELESSGGSVAVSDVTGMVNAGTSGGSLRFARVNGPLVGETSGGSIRANDCKGEIHVETSGGGIDVSGGGGSLHAETSGGGIKVKQFDGPASVETSGGGITLDTVNGKVQGETSGGSIHATLALVAGEVHLSTSGGGITVRVPATAAFNLHAETSGGGVGCDLPIAINGKKERSKLVGVVNGGGPAMKLETSGGGIHVRKM